MATVRVTVSDFPQGAQEGKVRWRAAGSSAPWEMLGTITGRVTEFQIPYSGRVEIEVYPVDRTTGQAGRSTTTTVDTGGKVAVTETLKQATIPDPEVSYSDGVITVRTKPPASTPADKAEIKYEVRTSEPEEGVTNAVLVGTVAAGESVAFTSWGVDNQTVHVQPINDRDNSHGDWNSVTVTTPVTPPDHQYVEDHAGTAFTSWTFDAIGDYTPLENSSGLRNKAVPSFWATGGNSIWGKTADPPIWGKRTYYPLGTVTSPAFDGGVVHEFMPTVLPEWDITTFATERPIWARTESRRIAGKIEDPDADTDFPPEQWNRRRRARWSNVWNTTAKGDMAPIEIEKEISTSQDAASYTDFAPLVEGKYYRARAYKMRFRLRCRRGVKQVRLSKLRLRRWIRNKKWEFTPDLSLSTRTMTYSYSPVPEIVGSVLSASVQILDSSPPNSTTCYDVLITSVSSTQIVFDVWEVDTATGNGSTPTVTDQKAHIILTGY